MKKEDLLQLKSNLFKAKTLQGKWVEGYYLRFNDFEIITPHSDQGFLEIDPKTLCQQVRGTEFFEGDWIELDDDGYFYSGFIVWNDMFMAYQVEDEHNGKLQISSLEDWQPTGKNIHD